MGTIKIVANADYSSNAVGKVDFNTGVFRRKVNGKLERYAAFLNNGYVDGYNNIDMSVDIIKVKTSFIYGRHSGAHRIFSVADYIVQRSSLVSHSIDNSGNLLIQTLFMVRTNVYAYTLNLGAAPTVDIFNYDIEFIIDFADRKIISITVNGVSKTIPTPTISTNATAWTNGQTRTICFGEVANYLNSSTVSNAIPYFGQVSDMNGDIFLHIDFLGDNDSERLMDKAKGIVLTKTAVVTIQSRPLDIV